MHLVATQNFINLINGWKKTNTTATPTSFSNAPDVDNGMNLITMGTGTGGSVYRALSVIGSDTTQRIVQMSTGGKLNADSGSNIPVWDRDLSVTNYNVGSDKNYLSARVIWIRPNYVTNPFEASSESPYSISIALTDDETPVTVETTNCQGNLYFPYSANVGTSSALNNKVYLTYRYDYPDASNAPSFTAKKILITTGIHHSMTTFPPIILAGGLLDSPIEVSYGMRPTFELTHDLTVAFS